MAEADRGAQAGAYLRMLLSRPGEPRSVWAEHSRDVRPQEIDYEAVRQALAEHAPGAATVETVRAALEGALLLPDTLDAFITTFRITPRHAGRLRDLLSGAESIRYISGAAPADLHRALGPVRHQTLALHELHTLGPDGLPAEHQTIQVIKSTVASLDSYECRFDTADLVFEVVRGGRVGDPYRIRDTWYAVDIALDPPLRLDETMLLHLRTAFFYRDPPPPEFRRGVRGTTDEVTLWVQFHPDRLPAQVWSARWDRLDGASVIEQEPVPLDDDLSVQVRFRGVADSIVGFRWSWD